MNRLIIIISIIVFLGSEIYAQQSVFFFRTKANLELVRISVKSSRYVDRISLQKAVNYLTSVTGIAPTTGGDYAGAFTPGEKDYYNWKTWLESAFTFYTWQAVFNYPKRYSWKYLRDYPVIRAPECSRYH